MKKTILPLVFVLFCSHLICADPLWGDLKAGEHAVGFTLRLQYDYSRIFRAKYDTYGKLYAGNRSRPIEIAIWYPATKTSQNHIRYEEYAWLIAQELNFDPLTKEKKQEAVQRFMQQRSAFTGASNTALQTLLSKETAATRDAEAKRGKFPLIVYAPGSGGTAVENTILCEYLASHGYIVASLPSMGAYARSASVDLTGFYAYMQDIEFVIGYMHQFPNVDPNALGIVGFSMGGSAATLVQMRNFDVDAAVYLDTGIIFDPVDAWFRPSNYYNKADLRAAQLYLVRKDADGLNPKQIEPAVFADTYVLLSEAGYRHPDFVADGMFGALINGYLPPGTKNAKTLYQFVCESTLDFLDAYVKHDRAKLQAFQTRVKQLNQGLFTGSFRAAATSPPREFEIVQMIRDGKIERVRELVQTMRQKYPDYVIFREATLNNVGYEFLFRNEPARAIAILQLNADAFPNSANAQDSLSEAYDAAGDHQQAAAHAQKGLELLAADATMDTERKARLKKILEERLQKLRAAAHS